MGSDAKMNRLKARNEIIRIDLHQSTWEVHADVVVSIVSLAQISAAASAIVIFSEGQSYEFQFHVVLYRVQVNPNNCVWIILHR
jgi:hypothetical protein